MGIRALSATAVSLALLAFGASPAGATKAVKTAASPQATIAEAPVPVPASAIPPAGRHLSADRVLEIAEALPKMRAVRRKYRGSYGGAYFKGPLRWQVSFFSVKGAKEIGQVIIADSTGRVLEQWTGFQIAWTMARGYPWRVRRACKCAVCLAATLPAVPASVYRLAPALFAAAPRSARAALVLGLARVLQPRAHLRLGAAHLPTAAVSARADARAAAPALAALGRAILTSPLRLLDSGARGWPSASSRCSAFGSRST